MTNHEMSKAYLDAYDRVLEIYKLTVDTYFKRTQILMIVIQSGLFIGLVKLVPDKLISGPDIKYMWLLPITTAIISIMGILSAIA